jgi:C4-type Zn-finger protein
MLLSHLKASRIGVVIMAKCPSCGKEAAKSKKTWKYGQFIVEVYDCKCGTRFRDYSQNGKHSFTLKLSKGKGYRKV